MLNDYMLIFSLLDEYHNFVIFFFVSTNHVYLLILYNVCLCNFRLIKCLQYNRHVFVMHVSFQKHTSCIEIGSQRGNISFKLDGIGETVYFFKYVKRWGYWRYLL